MRRNDHPVDPARRIRSNLAHRLHGKPQKSCLHGLGMTPIFRAPGCKKLRGSFCPIIILHKYAALATLFVCTLCQSIFLSFFIFPSPDMASNDISASKALRRAQCPFRQQRGYRACPPRMQAAACGNEHAKHQRDPEQPEIHPSFFFFFQSDSPFGSGYPKPYSGGRP